MNNINREPQATGSSRVNVGQNERIISGVAGFFLLLGGLRNLRHSPGTSLIQTVVGGYLAYKAASGHCPISEALGRNTAVKTPRPISIRETMTVNRPKEEVYAIWRKLENLPRFMKHLSNVKEIDNTRSHWEADLPHDMGTARWDAEIVEEREGELISWRSVPGSMVDTAGEVTFREVPGNAGTIISAHISYIPPAGDLGQTVAGLFNKTFEKQVRNDLARFKNMIEKGDFSNGTTGSSSTYVTSGPSSTMNM